MLFAVQQTDDDERVFVGDGFTDELGYKGSGAGTSTDGGTRADGVRKCAFFRRPFCKPSLFDGYPTGAGVARINGLLTPSTTLGGPMRC